MGDKPEQQLTEKIKQCHKTACNLKEEYESLLQKQKSTGTAGDSDHSAKKASLVDDVTKRLMDIDLALESIQKELKLALEQYLRTQQGLPASVDRLMIQCDANQLEVAKVTINQQFKRSDENKGQNEANLNPTTLEPQAILNGTQPALSTSIDRPMIQSDVNQMEVAKITINQQVELSDDNCQNSANLNSTTLEPQAILNGTLPEVVYIHLMSVMGIQECLLGNRLVCSLWNDLVLKRCRNQTSLKLFETFDTLMEYGELLLDYEKADDTSLILKSIGDDLLLEDLEIDHRQLCRRLLADKLFQEKQESAKFLTALFPKVEELVLALVLCPEDFTLINVKHLLQFYSEQLTSLTMTYCGDHDHDTDDEEDEGDENADDEDAHEENQDDEDVYGNLFFGRPGRKLRAFNFPKLKSLNAFGFSLEEAQLRSLLPQLESLTMQRVKMSLEALLRAGTQLRELNIDFKSVYTAPVEEFSKRPRFVTNLRKFSLSVTENDELQAMAFISLNLTSLECLKLSFHYYFGNLHSVTSYLVRLHQLRSLTLDAPVSFFNLDDKQLAEIKPLPSVRHLKLILWGFDSVTLDLSIDLFSRALFTAFPNVGKILIAFCCEVGVDTATFAAFEAFAGQHPNVVQLFRSKHMSPFTTFPNAVSPLLGHRRQVYEDYIEEEELFGLAICKLTASLVPRPGEDGPNLKSVLRPADRLTAMSNLFQLLDSGAFGCTWRTVYPMIERMIECALEYGRSQVALFSITCKCVLFLLDCLVQSLRASPFGFDGSIFRFRNLDYLLPMAEHYQKQQFKEDDLLLQIHNSMDEVIKVTMTLYPFLFDQVFRKLSGENPVHRVETARALLRICNTTKNCFRST